MTEDWQMRALAAEALNEELQDENERLRVELETAKSKLEQLRGGKADYCERAERWDVYYGEKMVSPAPSRNKLQRRPGMMLEYLPDDQRRIEPPRRIELPLEMDVEVDEDFAILAAKRVRLSLKVAGSQTRYHLVTLDGSPRAAALVQEAVGAMFYDIYGLNPPRIIHDAMLETYARKLAEKGIRL